MPDQKQTVIVEVRADEVREGDWVRCSTGRYGGSPEGKWFRASRYDETGTPFYETHLALEGRGGPAVYADSLVIVRRPVPSGADALREAASDAATKIHSLLLHVMARGLDKTDPHLRAACDPLVDVHGRLLDALDAVPAVASSGAEGGEREALAEKVRSLPFDPDKASESMLLDELAELHAHAAILRSFVQGAAAGFDGGSDVIAQMARETLDQAAYPASAGAEGEREEFHLCSQCGHISQAVAWTWWHYEEDADELSEVAPGVDPRGGAECRCPLCRFGHRDDDTGGFWGGSLDEMRAERARAVAEDVYGDWESPRAFDLLPAPAPAVTDPEGDAPNEFRVTPERVIGRWRWVGDWQNYPSPALEGMFVAPQRSAPAPSKETSTDA